MSVALKDKKKQELGIYYTPEVVVDFIYAILNILKKKEDENSKRWSNRKPQPHHPSVIDPACGEGIFLKKALDSGFTGYHPTYKVPYVFGIDIDKRAVERWEELALLDFFNSNRKAMENHFYGQNGLVDLPDRKLPYKKAEDGLLQFDAVVGNPPYGGVGLEKEEFTDELISKLSQFEVLPEKIRSKLISADKQGSLLDIKHEQTINPGAKQRLRSFPIEVLFIDRFIQLAKPGGWIAMIIPEGILANSNSHYVREFILQKTKVLAIISLPRDTFKNVGTNAKTSIIFLQKLRDEDNKDLNYKVFLSSIHKLIEEYFIEIGNSYKNFYYYGEL